MLAQSIVAILLLMSVHAVYESHPRYHQPIVGFLALIAAMPFVTSRDRADVQELAKQQRE